MNMNYILKNIGISKYKLNWIHIEDIEFIFKMNVKSNNNLIQNEIHS